MNGIHPWASVLVLAHATVACSAPESERHRNERVIDRVSADARAQPSGPGPIDGGNSTSTGDATSTIDAREYYCNVPEPGPCCCDPFILELRRSEAGSIACDFVIERPDKRRPVDTRRVNLVAFDASGAQSVLPRAPECSQDAPGWLIVPGDPPLGRLCPVTCQAVVSGEHVALQLTEGCYSIVCPPP